MKTLTTNLKQVLTVNHEQEVHHALKIHWATLLKKGCLKVGTWLSSLTRLPNTEVGFAKVPVLRRGQHMPLHS